MYKEHGGGGKTRPGESEDVGKGCRLGHRLAKCVRNVPDQQPGGMEERCGLLPRKQKSYF